MNCKVLGTIADRMTAVLLVLAFVALTSPGQAAERMLHPLAYADQELVYESGVGVVVSRGRFDIVARVQAMDRRNAWVHVTIYNGTSRPVTVADTAIDAAMSNGALKVLRYADLMKEEKRRQFWENLATGLAAGANSYGASQSGTYTQQGSFNGNVNTYGSGGYARSTVTGSYTTTGRDPVASQMATSQANAENQQMFANVSSTQLARTAALSNSVFRTETIEPGTSYGGAVQVVLPKSARGQSVPFEIVVTVDGERHPFMVIADAEPSTAMLQMMADETALPRTPVVVPTVSRVALVERQIEDPKYQDRVVVLDLEWTVTGYFGRQPIIGALVLEDDAGAQIRLPWTIRSEDAASGGLVQRGVEVPLLLGRADSDWLLTQAMAGAALRAKFEPR